MPTSIAIAHLFLNLKKRAKNKFKPGGMTTTLRLYYYFLSNFKPFSENIITGHIFVNATDTSPFKQTKMIYSSPPLMQAPIMPALNACIREMLA